MSKIPKIFKIKFESMSGREELELKWHVIHWWLSSFSCSSKCKWNSLIIGDEISKAKAILATNFTDLFFIIYV